MRRIETDDAARWLEFIWLGPIDSPWPFEARGRAWVMALVLCPPLTVLAALAVAPAARIAPLHPAAAVILTGVLALAAGVTAGVMITRAVGRILTHARPGRHWVALVAAETEAPRRPAPVHWHLEVPSDLDLSARGRVARPVDPANLFVKD